MTVLLFLAPRTGWVVIGLPGLRCLVEATGYVLDSIILADSYTGLWEEGYDTYDSLWDAVNSKQAREAELI